MLVVHHHADVAERRADMLARSLVVIAWNEDDLRLLPCALEDLLHHRVLRR